MNNPMMKEMMNNPEAIKMAMDMMKGQQPGGAGANPEDMKKAMENPSLQGMLNNPEMLSTSINMLKSNPAMLEMMSK